MTPHRLHGKTSGKTSGKTRGKTRRWRLLSALLALVVLAALAAQAACSQLPMRVPDLARSARGTVPVVGARGPLGAAQSQALLDRLQRRGGAPDLFERHLALEDALADSPLTSGNEVLLLQDGPATYRAMLQAIAAASNHVNLETYILDDDDVGQRFAQALIAKQQQGVQVHLIRDSVGTMGTSAAFFERLQASGIQVLEFNPINPLLARKDWELNQRDHRKLLVVDGRVAFLGGINLSSVYSGGSAGGGFRARPAGSPPWRDTDLQLRGPVVAELQKLFLATWAEQKGPPLGALNWFPPPETAGRQVVRAIASSPGQAHSPIYATLLSAIDRAQTSVLISNAYFAPDPQLLDTLMAAAARGVDVQLILPGQTDSWLIFHAGRGYYEPLLRAGVKIHERQGAILHSKTALIDGVWATVGSTNLDWRSFLHNHELNAVVLGAEFGARLRALFELDLAASQEIRLEAWQQRALHLRLQEALAGIWEYWL